MADQPSYRKKLDSKVAIITGGASGIGEATARHFAEHGARAVIIADVQDEKGENVAKSIGSNRCSYIHCDVRDEKQVKGLVESTVQKYGQLDIMFSNAGVGSTSETHILRPSTMEKFWGGLCLTFLIFRGLYPLFIHNERRNGGSNFGSLHPTLDTEGAQCGAMLALNQSPNEYFLSLSPRTSSSSSLPFSSKLRTTANLQWLPCLPFSSKLNSPPIFSPNPPIPISPHPSNSLPLSTEKPEPIKIL